MLTAETAEQELEQTRLELENIKSNRGAQFRDLNDESDSINKDIDKLSSERNAVMKDIGGQAVVIYDQLRKQRRGVAVATISDGSCAACGTTLTQSHQQNARSATQLFYCPSCGRVLYAN